MTETEKSRLYWAMFRRAEREEVGLASEPEPEQRSKWRGCDRDCFWCRYPDCMDPGTDLNDFERECLAIGHRDEAKMKGVTTVDTGRTQAEGGLAQPCLPRGEECKSLDGKART